jgi:hypothetical protein
MLKLRRAEVISARPPDGPEQQLIVTLSGDSTAAREAVADVTYRGLSRHDWRDVPVDLAGFRASGLPAQTIGRGPSEDPLCFAAALAGGGGLAAMTVQRARR